MRVRLSLLWVFAAALAVTLIGYFAFPTFSTIQSSPGGGFNVTPDTVYLNWTNNYTFNITLGASAGSPGNLTFYVQNGTVLVANYSQANTNLACTTGASGNFILLVQNSTNSSYYNATSPFRIEAGGAASLNLTDQLIHQQCLPGRYWNNSFQINAANKTGSNVENASITVIIDIPISSNNTLNTITGIGNFSGSFPVATPLWNSTPYHSFFFNTFAISGATSVSVNLTGWSSPQITDMYLIDDSGNIRARSINANTSQYLFYNYLPATPKMWEIRVYGNSTSAIPYTGFIVFSTLNITNVTNPDQQITSLNYGSMNISSTNTTNLNIFNNGTLTLQNVRISNTIYRINRFNGTGAKSFTFLVGDSSADAKIRASVLWNGSSNYTLNIYNTSGVLTNANLVLSSSNNYILENATNVTHELFNETTAITPGYWTASVVTNSGGNDLFNLNVSIYQASSWISTNFSTTTFSGQTGNVTQVNFTVPNSTLDGLYQGTLEFTDGNTGRLTIPINVSVTTPSLFVFNITQNPISLSPINSGTVRIDEDISATLSNLVDVNLTNVGMLDQIVNMTLNSANLVCTNCASPYTAYLNYSTVTNISHQSSQSFEINVTFNNTDPVGTYDGWIFINATNQTGALSSHPYSGYNLTVRLNLTNRLTLIPLFFGALLNGNISSPQSANETDNITMVISYVNGTPLGTAGALSLTAPNFTVFLQDGNVTSSLGNITNLLISNGTNPIFDSSNPRYAINYSVPRGALGGQYFVNPALVYLRNDGTTFYGSGSIGLLGINNTGLFMSAQVPGFGCSYGASVCSVSASLSPGATQPVFVNVTNYGGLTNTSLGETVNFTYSGCTGISITTNTSGTTCTVGSGSISQWPLNSVSPTSSCILAYTITAGSANTSSICNTIMAVNKSYLWYDPAGVNITVSVVPPTGSSSSSSSSSNAPSNLPPPNGTSTTIPQYLSISYYPAIIIVQQGTSNSTTVSVKNTNNTKTQNISLSISTANSSWASVSPSIQSFVLPLTSTSFTASFTIPADAAVNDYNSQFTATSSYASVSNNFTLRITPSFATKARINDTLKELILNYTQLSQQINQSKTAGLNTTDAEATLSLLTLKFQDAQNAVASGDYFAVSQTETQISQLLNQGYAALSAAKGGNPLAFFSNFVNDLLSFFNLQQNGKYAITAIVVSVVLILTYFFWPKIKEKIVSRPAAATFGRTAPSQGTATTTGEPEDDNAWDSLKAKWAEFNKKKK